MYPQAAHAGQRNSCRDQVRSLRRRRRCGVADDSTQQLRRRCDWQRRLWYPRYLVSHLWLGLEQRRRWSLRYELGLDWHLDVGLPRESPFRYSTLRWADPDASKSQRGNIPADITAEKPNYQSWGPPRARFESGETCNISQYFGAQTLIFNITVHSSSFLSSPSLTLSSIQLCGDWAGAVYNQAGFSGTCSQAVQDPRNFVNAEFEINYVKIFNLK